MKDDEIIESGLKFGPLTYGNNPIMLILHHAEASNCTVEDIHQWHLENKWAGIGYNFFISKEGTIYRGRPEDAVGSHCKGSNAISLGICAEGDYSYELMPPSQRNSIIELCIMLCEKYGIKQIWGHREVFNTECPGENYPLKEIRQAVFKKEVQKEVNKVNNIVVYNGEGSRPAGEMLAFYLQCNLISLELVQALSKSALDDVDNIYTVGGVIKAVERSKLLFGVDRFETMKEVLKFMKKL